MGAITLIVVVFEMKREAPRTLRSLTPPFQQGSADEALEIIVIDNGSLEPVRANDFEGLSQPLMLYRPDHPLPSPCGAINTAVRHASGEYVMVFIDGARLASPGLIASCRRAMSLDTEVFAYSLGFHLGAIPQQESLKAGYGPDEEDALLRSVNWLENGYRLFDICASGESYREGALGRSIETAGFMMRRSTFLRVGGFDERFTSPGGGFANFDFFRRVMEDDAILPVLTLGEGTFHQVHGGVTTQAGGVRRPTPEGDRTIGDAFAEELETLTGRAAEPVRRSPLLLGRFRSPAAARLFFPGTP